MNLKKRTIKKGAKRFLVSFLLAATMIWSTGMQFLLMAPVARAAVAESVAPLETLSTPATPVKGNSVVATDEISFVQASGSDTLVSVNVIIAGSGGLVSADIASVSLRKKAELQRVFRQEKIRWWPGPLSMRLLLVHP